MVIWGRTSRAPPPLLPTSRRSSSLRSSTSTSSWKQRSFVKSFSHNNVSLTCSQLYSVRAEDLLLSSPTPSRLNRDRSFILLFILSCSYVIIQVFRQLLNYCRGVITEPIFFSLSWGHSGFVQISNGKEAGWSWSGCRENCGLAISSALLSANNVAANIA